MGWIILGHHAHGVLATVFLNLFLRKVAEQAARAGYRPACGINDDGAPAGIFEGDRSGRPEIVQVFPDPVKICLALSVCPVWYVLAFGCHSVEVSSGSQSTLQLEPPRWYKSIIADWRSHFNRQVFGSTVKPVSTNYDTA